MRSRRRGLSFYCPRALTMLTCILVSTVLTLANLSVDPEWHSGTVWQKAYGWPLIWHRYVTVSWQGMAAWRTVGWFYSPNRLAANIAMWSALVMGTSAACEWLLRRYQPRLRFSVRVMLVAVGLVAALCGWFVAARRRADLQDQIVADAPRVWGGVQVAFRRWGARWLDLVGADRYRRTIVGCAFSSAGGDAEEEGGILTRLAKLPSLRYVDGYVESFTPGIAEALNDMRQLRYLSLERVMNDKYEDDDEEWRRRECLPPIGKLDRLEELKLRDLGLTPKSLAGLPRLKSITLVGVGFHDDPQIAHECLVAIGKATGLEYLALEGLAIRGESLAQLADLAKLKSLTLSLSHIRSDARPLLSRLPRLPQLENLGISGSSVGDQDLQYLSALPRLRALGLSRLRVTVAGLAALASLESLEELAIDGERVSPEVFQSLRVLKQLKKLRLYFAENSTYSPYAKVALDNGKELSVPESQVDAFRRELRAFRQDRPGVVIDADFWQIERHGALDDDLEGERDPEWFAAPTWLPKSDWPWLAASEVAEFRAQGGRASFNAARWRDRTVSF